MYIKLLINELSIVVFFVLILCAKSEHKAYTGLALKRETFRPNMSGKGIDTRLRVSWYSSHSPVWVVQTPVQQTVEVLTFFYYGKLG